MRQPGLVSIVVAAFNAEPFIAETLASVLSQDYPLIEVIVVDDGSSDGTSREVAKFGDKVAYVRQDNSGGGSAPRNAGARLAHGEFLGFFDADDLMMPGRIRRQVDFLAAHPEAVAAVMNYRNFSDVGDHPVTHFETCTELMRTLGGRKSLLLEPGQARDLLIPENFAITGGVLYRAQAFNEAGGFDQSLFIGEDLELLYRVSRQGGIGVVDAVGFRRRLHGTNISHREEFNLRQKIRSRTRMLEGESAPSRRSGLEGRLRECQLSLADFLSRRSPSEALELLGAARQYGENLLSFRVGKIFLKCMLVRMRLLDRKS